MSLDCPGSHDENMKLKIAQTQEHVGLVIRSLDITLIIKRITENIWAPSRLQDYACQSLCNGTNFHLPCTHARCTFPAALHWEHLHPRTEFYCRSWFVPSRPNVAESKTNTEAQTPTQQRSEGVWNVSLGREQRFSAPIFGIG